MLHRVQTCGVDRWVLLRCKPSLPISRRLGRISELNNRLLEQASAGELGLVAVDKSMAELLTEWPSLFG